MPIPSNRSLALEAPPDPLRDVPPWRGWRRFSTLSLALALALLPWVVRAGEGEPLPGVNFLQAPEGARAWPISLAVVENPGHSAPGYLGQRSPQPLEEAAAVPSSIADAYAGKEFFTYQIAALPNGTRYLAVVHDEKSVKFLNRNEPNMWYARFYQVPGPEAQPELLREGFQFTGTDVTIPVDFPLPGIGMNKVQSFRTEIGYSINGSQNGRPQIFSGRGSPVQVAGSQISQAGKLTLTLTVPETLTVTSETQAALQFQPLQPGLPDHMASGKITDFLTLGSARFIVTSVAPDFSRATIAVVEGSLEQTVKQQLELGTQLPAFSQVELVTRRTVTREELLGRARQAAGLVFVFGDIASGGPGGRFPNRMGPPAARGEISVLPLPPAELVEQLEVELQPKPLVILVTRQIAIEFLYDDLRNKTPQYLVLTDFADPLRTSFRVPQNYPGAWYGPPFQTSDEPSLRQLFNLPANALSVVAFDREGKVAYVKANAGNGFLPALAEARGVLAQLSGRRR